MDPQIAKLILFVIMATLGSFTSAVLRMHRWEDLKKYEIQRTIILGPIAGVLYFYMYLDYSLPDSVMAFFFGYSFESIVNQLAVRFLGIKATKGGGK